MFSTSMHCKTDSRRQNQTNRQTDRQTDRQTVDKSKSVPKQRKAAYEQHFPLLQLTLLKMALNLESMDAENLMGVTILN